MTLLYLCGYILVYPVIKKKYWYKRISLNFFNKYLLGIDNNGDLHKIFISRVSIQSGYEVFSYNKRSNLFKLCRAIYGTRQTRTAEFAKILPNDLIGHYVLCDMESREYKKAPSNKMFPAELASRCISFCSSNKNSIIFLDAGMIKNFIKSRQISLD